MRIDDKRVWSPRYALVFFQSFKILNWTIFVGLIVKGIESPMLDDKPSNCDTLAPLKTAISPKETPESLKLIAYIINKKILVF